MTGEEWLNEFDELLSRSSLGDEGVLDLCARTDDGALAGILYSKSMADILARLDPSPDEEGRELDQQAAEDPATWGW
jgi:hypothetical protein